jgi:hypothetical protein
LTSRAGDADAFGAVFDACAKSVYNHAKGTLMQEIVFAQNTEVAAPGDR